MCFSETQSYINAILLFFVGLHKISEWRIGIPLIFLGTKDLLQGFLYKYLNSLKANYDLELIYHKLVFYIKDMSYF